MHAEAMLLVDHHEREVAEGDRPLEQGMGADKYVDVACLESLKDRRAVLAALPAREECHAYPARGGHGLDGCQVLARQQFRGRHQCGLGASLDGGRHGQ